jgi:hypothetical protein
MSQLAPKGEALGQGNAIRRHTSRKIALKQIPRLNSLKRQTMEELGEDGRLIVYAPKKHRLGLYGDP